jgi:hypothetical protein
MKKPILLPAVFLPLVLPALAQATSFGALSNFDAVNDTGTPCNGFEIELDDVESKDVTYTFNYQRYGLPKIVEDRSDPSHPKVFVRWMSPYDQTGHAFTATTPVAAANFQDTGGHACFTGMNPNGIPYDQSGCEHFGVGTLKNPTNTIYRWMKEDPATPGALIADGNPVSIPAPSWTVAPAAGGAVNVKAVIPVPAPPAVVPVPYQPNGEFGVAAWAKVMETESENPGKLNELVSDDPHVPGNKGGVQPPNTVTEIEWQILQKDFKNPNVNELAIEKPMGKGNENVTRRYEFYKYVGPYDLYDSDPGSAGTNEALCPEVGADGIHGRAGQKASSYNQFGQPIQINCGTTVVVGDYIGAQMAGADVALPLSANGVRLPDGEVGVKYPNRPLIFGGSGGPYSVNFVSGSLPAWQAGHPFKLNPLTGVLKGGIPTAAAKATFKISASDLADPAQPVLAPSFTIKVVAAVKVNAVVVPQGVTNADTAVELKAHNGESPFKWSATALTPGLSASIVGGNQLVLNAPANGTYNVRVTVVDSLGGKSNRTLSYTVGN